MPFWSAETPWDIADAEKNDPSQYTDARACEEGTLHDPTIVIVLFGLIRSLITNLMFLDQGMW